MTRRIGGILAAWLVLGAATAYAGNDDEILVGNQAAMAAGAVTATVASSAALVYNPAGLMGSSDENHLDATATLYGLRRYSTDQLLALPANATDGEHVNEILVVPSTLGYVRELGSLRVGFGFFQRRATAVTLRAAIDDDVAEGRVDWGLIIQDDTRLYDAALGLAFDAHETLSIGFTVHGLVRSTSGLIDFAGGLTDGVSGDTTHLISQSLVVSETDVGARLSAGLQWAPHPRVRLGLSVDSPSRVLFTTSTIDAVFVAHNPRATAFVADIVEESGFTFERQLPARVRLGLAVEGEWGWLALDGDVQHAVEDEEAGVERRFVWNLRLGGVFPLSDVIQIGAGLFTDRSSDTRPESFGAARADSYGGTLGVRYDDVMSLAEGEEAPRIRFGTTLALRYAYGRGDVAGLTVAPVPDFGDAEVTQTRLSSFRVHEVGIHLGSRLSF